MTASARTILVACLLIGVAVVLAVTKDTKARNATESTVTAGIPRRSAKPEQRVAGRHPIPAYRSSQDLRLWARGLSDEMLRKLTREVLEDFESPPLRKAMIPALTALAMEWGRRDFDESIEAIAELRDSSNPAEQFENYSLKISLLQSLHAAAAAGLAEDDPARAWQEHQKHHQLFSARTNADFIFIPNETTALATEAITRAWTEQDPESAWQAISNGNPSSINLAAAIRGLLAVNSDPVLRDTVLKWVNKQAIGIVIPGIPVSPGADVVNISGSKSIAGDGAITRNSIDSILNNPNRHDPDALVLATAMGLANQDPGEAWSFLNSPDRIPTIGGAPVIGRLFDQSQKGRFLEELASNKPDTLDQFVASHESVLNPELRVNIANGMGDHDPEGALGILAGIDDESQRLESFKKWVARPVKWIDPTNPWPLIEERPASMPFDQQIRATEDNLGQLMLSPTKEAEAMAAIEEARSRKELLQKVDTTWDIKMPDHMIR